MRYLYGALIIANIISIPAALTAIRHEERAALATGNWRMVWLGYGLLGAILGLIVSLAMLLAREVIR